MKISKMIAYQTVDRGGDIWCNEALLFNNQSEVNAFFSNPKLVIETLGYEIEPYEDINNCITLLKNNEGDVTGVDICLEYCGSKQIRKMSCGYVISKESNA